MSGRPAYDRETYGEDIRRLRARGYTWDRISRELGISRTTLWRIEGQS